MKRSSFRFASRPVRVALAIKIAFCFLAADVSLAAAKVLWTKGGDAAATTATAAQVSLTQGERCREVQVEIDDGYGVRGQVIRTVCRKAL